MKATIQGLDHIQIAAPPGAQEKAREFYGSLLGLKELEVPLALRDRATTWFECGALQIHIGIQQNFQPAKKAHPAFVTTHLQELLDRLKAHGVPTVEDQDRPGIARFFTEDPWGNRLEFMEMTS
jgi:catechol 2,3-dioxygenase-like lactoylglutathione lyase family enzyme